MQISVDSDIKKVTRWLNESKSKAIPSATSQALNVVGRTIKREGKKRIAKVLRVKQPIIEERMGFKGARVRKPAVEISLVRKPISYAKITKNKKTDTGVRNKYGTFTGAFVATMPTKSKTTKSGPYPIKLAKAGHSGIFMRRSAANSPAQRRKQPLRRVKSGKNIGKTYRPALPIYERMLPITVDKGIRVLEKTALEVKNRDFPRVFEDKLARKIRQIEAKTNK